MRLAWLPWSLGSLFLSAGCFRSGQKTWEIGKDPFRGISWMPLSVNCWAEANTLFYVFNFGRTLPPPQHPVSADSCSWESFVWEPGRSDSGQQLLDTVKGCIWSCPCRVAMDLKAQGTSLSMQIFKQSPSVWSLEGRPCHFGFLLVFWDLVTLLVSDVSGRWAEDTT